MVLDFTKFTKHDVIDCHVHLWMLRDGTTDTLFKQQEKALTEAITQSGIQSMYVFGYGDDAPLTLKKRHPDRFHAGAYIPWSSNTENLQVTDWDKYITSLKAKGYDGVGETGSKTAPRSKHTPLDSEYYTGFWTACEKQDFPVLCHVGDVEDFWYEDRTPQWAKDRNWGYYNGDYPTLQELYAEVENILGEHPSLKIAFCHFLFMSPDIEQADQFLIDYPNACLDLSLGVELMYNISRNRDEYHDFFKKHDDRILFGTDIGMSTTFTRTSSPNLAHQKLPRNI